MKKTGRILLSKIVFVFCLVFFSTAIFTPASAPASEWKWPKSITVLTAGTASGVYMTLFAALSEMEKMTGMKIRIIPEDSYALKQRITKQKLVDFFGDGHGSLAVLSMMGEEEFATRTGGPFQARSVWLIYNSYLVFYVRAGSDIKTIYDIKPHHKIAAYEGVRTSRLNCEALLKWVNVDAVLVPCATWASTQTAVIDGRSDISPIVTTSPKAYEAEAMPGGIRCLALDAAKDPAGAKRFLEHARVRTLATIKVGFKSSIGVPSVMQPFAIHAHADSDPELVYHFVKWLAENNDAYKGKHKNCKYMSLASALDFMSNSALPIHDGTIRYLKEVGKWTTGLDTQNEEAKKLLTRYVKAYEAAIAEADKRKIKKLGPRNKKWMALWENYKKDIPPIVSRVPKQIK